MIMIKLKPTSPGRRGMIKIFNTNLYKGKSYKPLTVYIHKCNGRNSYGRITTWHKGGGHKRLYRKIDWKRKKKRKYKW